jgi:hypothetical protein
MLKTWSLSLEIIWSARDFPPWSPQLDTISLIVLSATLESNRNDGPQTILPKSNDCRRFEPSEIEFAQ